MPRNSLVPNARRPGLTLTYIGGPTVLVDWDGIRLLTDPTFDPAGGEYATPAYVLRKTQSPALAPESLLPVDAVLLSHDHHFDNLDRSGRRMLEKVGRVLTTEAGAGRLGGHTVGLEPWAYWEMPGRHGRTLRITATPARHGPEGGDRGPVIGFVLAYEDDPTAAAYISGDTVWYEGVAEVSRRFAVRWAVLFVGAARVPAVGPAHLTLTAEEAVVAARAFDRAAIIPAHFEGWAHFSESREELEQAFRRAGLAKRLHALEVGETIGFPLDPASAPPIRRGPAGKSS